MAKKDVSRFIQQKPIFDNTLRGIRRKKRAANKELQDKMAEATKRSSR